MLAGYAAMCLIFFLAVQRPLFMVYNSGSMPDTWTIGDIAQIYLHGFTLDLASMAYIVALPCLMAIASLFTGWHIKRALTIYNIVVAVVMAMVTCGDTVMYDFWHTKLDSTIFLYLGDPKNAVASVSTGFVAARLLMCLLTAIAAWAMLMLPVLLYDERGIRRQPWPKALAFALPAIGVVFYMIRGGESRPKTISTAVFSEEVFYNHAAVNPVFSMAYTSAHVDDFSKMFRFYPEKECASDFARLMPQPGGTTEPLLNTSRPNILLIVVEGFGSHMVGALGGPKGVTPCFDQLTREGVWFSQCYASSFRTDRGIVATLNGYPGQPTTSIISYPRKVASIPALPKALLDNGYSTEMVYAGDMNYFNMADYYMSAGHRTLVSDANFDKAERTQSWGVPDGTVAKWLLGDIKQRSARNGKPWYITWLTLSSHEPFDVPYHRQKDKKQNAFAYTDSVLGNFINELRATKAWKNTLVVFVADHNFNEGFQVSTTPDFFHVPMLMIGGAVKKPCRIDRIVSQTDIPATVLGQLHLPHGEFKFSRDVMNSNYRQAWAFSTYNNGFVMRDDKGYTDYDNNEERVVSGANAKRERNGRVILQTLYEDMSRR